MSVSKKLFYILTVFINLLLVFATFSSMKEGDFRTYFNSDTLYLGSLYKDIFIDGTGFKGWYLNAAPNFFPDMFLYFIVNFLFSDFRVAYIVFSFVQYFLILFLLNVLLKSINKEIKNEYLVLLNLLFPIFLLVALISGNYLYTYFVFSHSFHTGVFINFLLASILFFKSFKSNNIFFLLLLSIITIIGTYNDRLFLVLFSVPVLSVFLFNLFFIKNKQIKISGFAVILSTVLSLVLFKYTNTNNVFTCISLDQKYMNFDNILISLDNLISQHIRYIKELRLQGFISIIAGINFFILPVFIIKKYKKYKQHISENKFIAQEVFYLVFIFISIFLTLFTPVINGYYLGEGHLRYNIFSFYLSVFNIVFFLYFVVKNRKIYIYSVSAVIFIFYTFSIIKVDNEKGLFSGVKKLGTFYPEKVRIIDEFAVENNLKFGLSEYWDAKYTIMFSKNNLRVYTVINEKLDPWYHVMNKNWYFDYDKGRYNKPLFSFILTNKFDANKIKANFGEPVDSLMYENKTILYVMNNIKFKRENNKAYLVNDEK
ncbi:MAG: hypothetical protein L3J35_03145 [Bacteroidales bacterium]|nr:hypothetical protein [Bacteroidales bacterium]